MQTSQCLSYRSLPETREGPGGLSNLMKEEEKEENDEEKMENEEEEEMEGNRRDDKEMQDSLGVG